MRAAIALLMACALAFAPATAIAQEDTEDRRYDVEVSDQRAEITLPRDVDERSAEHTVVLDTEQGLLSGSFGFAEADDAQSLDLSLHQLVEYRDENDNGTFDEDDDIASAWRLSPESENATGESNATVEWRTLETHNVTAENDVEGTQVQAVAEFPEQDPIAGVVSELGESQNRTLTINLTVFEDEATYEGTEVAPSEVHVAWTIDNYPYTSEDTQLALVTEADGAGEIVVDVGDEPSLASTSELDGYDVTVDADLQKQATIDGEDSEVHLSQPAPAEDAEAEHLVAVSYDHGDTIEHELLIGSHADALSESTIDSATDQVTGVPGPGAFVAVSVVAAAAALVRRG
jgi:hypothetical protein